MFALAGFVLFTLGVLVLTIAWTWRDDHSSSVGYFLGGRSLTGVTIAGSLMLTNLSTEQLTGLSGQAFSQGIHVMAWEVFAAFAMILLALYFLPRYLKRGIATTPQFLEERFDKTTRSMVSFLFMAGYTFIILPVVLYTGALTINGIFDVPALFQISHTTALWITIWGIGLLGSVYAIWGGLRAVAISDTINGIGLVAGGLMIPVLGLHVIGEGDLVAGFRSLMAANPDRFISNGGNQAEVPWHTLFTGMLLINMYYWCTNQAITQRVLGAKNLAEGQKGVLLAAFLKVLGPLIVVLPGIIAWHLFADEIIATGKADQAYPILVKHLLGNGIVKGLFAGVLVGAVLSSFNSGLNSAATLFSLGFYKEYFRKQADDDQVVASGKMVGVLLALVAMCLAPALDRAGSIFAYIQKMNGIYNVPVITIFLVGFLNKRVTALAAKVAMVFGSLFYSLCLFGAFDTWLGRVHFLHYFAIAFALSAALMLFFPRRHDEFVAGQTDALDLTPWNHRLAASFAVAVLAISVYVVFWNPDHSVEPSLELRARLQQAAHTSTTGSE
ncbi:MAG: solute:sodium symporter family transporter [Leptospiraceae bacterium]|nr:solute:sodium symporter family transporter [Leptospiraceae bacterium]